MPWLRDADGYAVLGIEAQLPGLPRDSSSSAPNHYSSIWVRFLMPDGLLTWTPVE